MLGVCVDMALGCGGGGGGGAPAVDGYLLMEDGFRFLLEDGSGFLLLG